MGKETVSLSAMLVLTLPIYWMTSGPVCNRLGQGLMHKQTWRMLTCLTVAELVVRTKESRVRHHCHAMSSHWRQYISKSHHTHSHTIFGNLAYWRET